MYLKHLMMGFVVCWETLDEMGDVIASVLKLRAKFPNGRTALTNDVGLTQEEADRLLEQLGEIVRRLDRDGAQLLAEARPVTRSTESGHKSHRENLQAGTTTSALGEMQSTQAVDESSETAV